MIYADHAATTKTSPAAQAAMLRAMERFWGNPSSLYQAGRQAAEELERCRAQLAACIGAQPQEIFFTSGGSEADNQALRSAAWLGKRRGKTHLISTAIEHHAVLHTLARLEQEGFSVTLLPVDASGVVRTEAVEAALRPETALVSVMYANNEIGTIQPIAEIGALCRAKRVLFHTDAVQAVGHLPVDPERQNVDMLSLSGHKFGGPRGVGALYVRRGLPLRPLIEGGGQERGKRAGTENLAAIAGMAAALEEAAAHLPQNAARLTALQNQLIAGLSGIPHGALNGDALRRLPGSVNFCFEGVEGEPLLLLLDERGIAASSGSACTAGSLDPSHVLLAIGRPYEIAHGALRLTLGEENTPEEVEQIITAVRETVAQLRSSSPVWKEAQQGLRPHLL